MAFSIGSRLWAIDKSARRREKEGHTEQETLLPVRYARSSPRLLLATNSRG
jgi:hypothetical protein